METICDFCEKGRATVYCKADSAWLCLSCDRVVHSANNLSLRHHRTLLCDGCNAEPASVRCRDENLSLCPDCDLASHNANPSGANHSRHVFECFTGCPSAADLAKLWGCDMAQPPPLLEVQKAQPASSTSTAGGGALTSAHAFLAALDPDTSPQPAEPKKPTPGFLFRPALIPTLAVSSPALVMLQGMKAAAPWNSQYPAASPMTAASPMLAVPGAFPFRPQSAAPQSPEQLLSQGSGPRLGPGPGRGPPALTASAMTAPIPARPAATPGHPANSAATAPSPAPSASALAPVISAPTAPAASLPAASQNRQFIRSYSLHTDAQSPVFPRVVRAPTRGNTNHTGAPSAAAVAALSDRDLNFHLSQMANRRIAQEIAQSRRTGGAGEAGGVSTAGGVGRGGVGSPMVLEASQKGSRGGMTAGGVTPGGGMGRLGGSRVGRKRSFGVEPADFPMGTPSLEAGVRSESAAGGRSHSTAGAELCDGSGNGYEVGTPSRAAAPGVAEEKFSGKRHAGGLTCASRESLRVGGEGPEGVCSAGPTGVMACFENNQNARAKGGGGAGLTGEMAQTGECGGVAGGAGWVRQQQETKEELKQELLQELHSQRIQLTREQMQQLSQRQQMLQPQSQCGVQGERAPVERAQEPQDMDFPMPLPGCDDIFSLPDSDFGGVFCAASGAGAYAAGAYAAANGAGAGAGAGGGGGAFTAAGAFAGSTGCGSAAADA
ncbi:unnamed protein product [Closterium sp. Naga37s-1]|nr:unnamed protein product [Closterium sp. Naga37s-1]